MVGATDAFEPWQKIIESISCNEPGTVLRWLGENVSEVTFRAMSCWQLRQCKIPLSQIVIKGGDDPPYVAFHSPAELAAMYASRQKLTHSERLHYSEAFATIRHKTGLLRRWENGQIGGVPVDHYDRLLMESCTHGWAPAPRVVGTAMSRCDSNNLMSGVFFFSRLRALRDAACIETDALHKRLRDCSVRLAKGGNYGDSLLNPEAWLALVHPGRN